MRYRGLGRNYATERIAEYHCSLCRSGSIVSRTSSITPNLLLIAFRDHYEEVIQFPIDIGYDIGGVYDWNVGSVPQTQLDGAARGLPMGRVVGGGSILNGMIWNV